MSKYKHNALIFASQASSDRGLLYKAQQELQLSMKLQQLTSLTTADLGPENKRVLSMLLYSVCVFH